ncbi:MAG: nickel pincer cofactor biosynthesis protein LarB [Acidimicrobiales bacterium]|nr:nickel pincer cofactor biosynthesis protein LarB [Acidimicrobiales bacterium]
MDEPALRALLVDVAAGTVSADDAVRQLRRLPFADLGFARIDHHRHLRQGFPEAVYGPGKSPEHCAAVVAELLAAGTGPVLLTRADDEQVKACLAVAPDGARHGSTVVWRATAPAPADSAAHGPVAVLTAGTADLPVAEECDAVLQAHGVAVRRLSDVGVAGLHRLLAGLDRLDGVRAVIVVAGMEGALVSVIGGLVGVPVIAVPTSVGYGAGLDGVTALLAMLASCASGVTVVGIDNGFGAACAALRLLNAERNRP